MRTIDIEGILEDYCNDCSKRAEMYTEMANYYDHGTSHADERTRDHYLVKALKEVRRISEIHDWLDF